MSMGLSPRDFLGSTDFNKKFPITIEMIEAVELFVDTVKAVCDEFSIPHDRIKSEEHLVHPAIPGEMLGGTTDCQVPGDDVLIIADLKFGRRPVYANSIQLTAYSLLSLANIGRPFSRVIQLIIQPRSETQVSRYEPGAAELEDAWDKICKAAKFVPIYRTGEYGRVRFLDKKTGQMRWRSTKGKLAKEVNFDQGLEGNPNIKNDKRRIIKRAGLARKIFRVMRARVLAGESNMVGEHYAVRTTKTRAAGKLATTAVLHNALTYLTNAYPTILQTASAAAARGLRFELDDKIAKRTAQAISKLRAS
jgi:hypothetical protein